MTKYRTMVQRSAAEWSSWTTPAVKYKLACCDCGLVHDVQFCVRLKGGKLLDRRRGQIKFRVRKNEAATAAMRREDAKRAAKTKLTVGRERRKA